MDKLEPWDLEQLKGFDEQFLSGFQTETYQVNLEDGFGIAKEKMHQQIVGFVHRDIGGDQQRITNIHVNYDEITFKHILLPLWISSYRYDEKIYRFLINNISFSY